MRADDRRHRITDAALSFSSNLVHLTETQLAEGLPDAPPEGEPWFGYLHDPRSVALYLELRLWAESARLFSARANTRAVEIARIHHRAYRDLTGALVGIDAQTFDQPPADGEWPVRTVVNHITIAELAFTRLIDWAVQRQRRGNGMPMEMPTDEVEARHAEIDAAGLMEDVMATYASIHQEAIDATNHLSGSDLEAVGVWWEGYPVTVWFRMHRYAAHLREHTIQIDKTLAALEQSPTESERLARGIHLALADVEIALSLDLVTTATEFDALAEEFETQRERLTRRQ